MLKTVIFGGTFNPFHIGHYEMLSALENMDFINQILVTPDNIPPHKSFDFLASNEDRAEMCRIICGNFSKAEICLDEIERGGKSYTYNTVLRLKEKYPGKKFFLVCGGDMIMTLESWYNYRELIKEAGIIAFFRCGLDRNQFRSKIEKIKADGADITVSDKIITDVSSTFIRQNISKASVKQLLPPVIYEYLHEKGLYNGHNNT